MKEPEQGMAQTIAWRVYQTFRDYPGNPALEISDRRYTYRELYNAATSISMAIRELDTTNPFVAVMADKSFSCYAGILGALLAGKAYLPLNPRYPAARNLFMLEKASIRIVIAGEGFDDELEAILDNFQSEVFVIFSDETEQNPGQDLLPKIVQTGDPAYLLFTSGTTGRPKGVPVSNENLNAYLDFMLNTYDFSPDDRFTQIFDLTFDLSVHDIFLAWSTGACLCVPDDNSSFAMSRFIREKQPTVWFSVPSVVELMDRMRLLKEDTFPSVRLSFFCGEALSLHSAEAWKKSVSHSRIINLYGPTEATIAISQYELPEKNEKWKSEIGIVSIGKVFKGNSFTIRNDELLLSGNQVVDSYFENKEADHAAFIIDEVSGIKWYLTGDIVKTDNDGDLFYLGRKDSEVKISGYRVNLKEIENVLAKHEKVARAVVVYDNTADSQGIILGFVLAVAGQQPEEKELDDLCRGLLPWYMLPGKFIFVDDIPLNLNGKVDINELKKRYAAGNRHQE